jgi:chaperone BCS1
MGVLGGDRALVGRILAEGARLAARTGGPELHALRDGWWESLGELAPRPLSSVAAPDDRLDRALADLRAFLAARAWYEARGVPLRRGDLLRGPPGTGKSSAVRALATEAGLDVAVIDLSRPDLTDDAPREGLAVAPKGALLLMEDVDAAFSGREEGPGGGGGGSAFRASSTRSTASAPRRAAPS